MIYICFSHSLIEIQANSFTTWKFSSSSCELMHVAIFPSLSCNWAASHPWISSHSRPRLAFHHRLLGICRRTTVFVPLSCNFTQKFYFIILSCSLRILFCGSSNMTVTSLHKDLSKVETAQRIDLCAIFCHVTKLYLWLQNKKGTFTVLSHYSLLFGFLTRRLHLTTHNLTIGGLGVPFHSCHMYIERLLFVSSIYRVC